MAPTAKAPSLIEGGTDRSDALEAIIIVGSVINDKTIPPTRGDDRGKSKYPRNIDNPNKPNTIEGTAAKLFMFTSMISDKRFFGANCSKKIAADTPIGNDKIKHTNSESADPTRAARIPAISGSRLSPFLKLSLIHI